MQVHGEVVQSPDGMKVLPPEESSRVSAHLFIETPFEQRRMTLQRELHEEDVHAVKYRLASGAIEEQLQRAILYAASCLGSKNKELCRVGAEVLECVEQLER